MIKKYRATHYSGKISAVEVTRETDSSVFILSGLGAERRRAKTTEYESYHDTFEEAREALSNRLRAKLAYAKSKVDALESKLVALYEKKEES